jgi:hypothetical protein
MMNSGSRSMPAEIMLQKGDSLEPILFDELPLVANRYQVHVVGFDGKADLHGYQSGQAVQTLVKSGSYSGRTLIVKPFVPSQARRRI